MDSPPLLFSSSHFRRICADLAARYAINRRTLDRCGCESPRRGPSVDPLNTIGMERRGGNFEVASFERIIYYPSLFSGIRFEVIISSRKRWLRSFLQLAIRISRQGYWKLVLEQDSKDFGYNKHLEGISSIRRLNIQIRGFCGK